MPRDCLARAGVFTVILYANEGWEPAHGGCLRMYEGEDSYVDIQPLGGRILVFMSMLQHEVLPAYAQRFALTLWMWRYDGDDSKADIS